MPEFSYSRAVLTRGLRDGWSETRQHVAWEVWVSIVTAIATFLLYFTNAVPQLNELVERIVGGLVVGIAVGGILVLAFMVKNIVLAPSRIHHEQQDQIRALQSQGPPDDPEVAGAAKALRESVLRQDNQAVSSEDVLRKFDLSLSNGMPASTLENRIGEDFGLGKDVRIYFTLMHPLLENGVVQQIKELIGGGGGRTVMTWYIAQPFGFKVLKYLKTHPLTR